MKPLVRTYHVKVVREAGPNPITGECWPYEEQEMNIDAISRQAAFVISELMHTLTFRGQLRRTFIDGEEYFDERY
jgi:hypothetical protein